MAKSCERDDTELASCGISSFGIEPDKSKSKSNSKSKSKSKSECVSNRLSTARHGTKAAQRRAVHVDWDNVRFIAHRSQQLPSSHQALHAADELILVLLAVLDRHHYQSTVSPSGPAAVSSYRLLGE